MREWGRRLSLAVVVLVATGVNPAAAIGSPMIYRWGAPIPIPTQQGLFATRNIECPSTHECVITGSENSGDIQMLMVSFDPLAPPTVLTPQYIHVDGATTILGFDVSCPSAAQCSTIDSNGRILTFSPPSADATVSATGMQNFVSCPDTNLCVSSPRNGPAGPAQTEDIVAFNPLSPGPRTDNFVSTGPPGSSISGMYGPDSFADVQCPSAVECVAVHRNYDSTAPAGQPKPSVTFDPSGQGEQISRELFPGNSATAALVCPTNSECLAEVKDAISVFDPASAQDPPVSMLAGVQPGPYDLTCPAADQCLTGDGSQGMPGGAPHGLISFDPAHPESAVREPMFTDLTPGARTIIAIGCATPAECVLIGQDDSGTTAYVGQAETLTPAAALTVGSAVVRDAQTALSVSCDQRVHALKCPVTATLTVTSKAHRTRIAGRRTADVAPGTRTQIRIALDRVSRRTLRRSGHLEATLRVIAGGRLRATRRISFRHR